MSKIREKQWPAEILSHWEAARGTRTIQLLTGPIRTKVLPGQLQKWFAISTQHLVISISQHMSRLLKMQDESSHTSTLIPRLWFRPQALVYFWGNQKSLWPHLTPIWTSSSLLKLQSGRRVWICGQPGVVASCCMRESGLNRKGPR